MGDEYVAEEYRFEIIMIQCNCCTGNFSYLYLLSNYKSCFKKIQGIFEVNSQILTKLFEKKAYF